MRLTLYTRPGCRLCEEMEAVEIARTRIGLAELVETLTSRRP